MTAALASHPRASQVRTDTTNFNNNLSAADVNVQLALDTTDEIAGGGPGAPLAPANIYVGSALGIATAVPMTGDIGISNTGITSIATGVIVNLDVAVGAAIALTKLATVTASRALVSDISGYISASSVTATELGLLSGLTGVIPTITAYNAGRVVFEGASSFLDDALLYWDNTGKNLGVGTSTFGTNAARVIGIGGSTAPTTSPADMVQVWSADRAATAGKASFFVRTEDGTSHVLGDLAGIGTLLPAAKLDLLGSGSTSATKALLVQNSSTNEIFTVRDDRRIGVNQGTPAATVDIVQPATAAATSILALLLTPGAHTALTAGTEASDVSLALARTVEFATGALPTQRAVLATAPTYGFVGASTLTDAMTVAVAGAPVAGANATLTRSHALHIGASAVGAGVTTSYGLTVNAQTGGGTNYAAQFVGGNVQFQNQSVSTVPYLDANRALVSSSVTPTELGYVSGVTSAIQTQLNAKEPTLTKGNLTEATSTVLTITGGTGSVIGAGTSIQVKDAGAAQTGVVTTGAQTLAGAKTLSTAPILSSLTASQILALDGANNVQSLTVATYPSLVELAYVKGVTSAIQTQINGKITSPTWNAGRVMFHGASGVLDDAEFFWDNTSKSLGVGVATFGTNGVNVFALGTGVAPTTSPADSVQLWEADRNAVAGKGSLHVRTEDGTSHVIGDLSGIGTMTPGATLDVVQAITASATAPNAFQVVGAAHTALTLSTEAIDVDFNLARTVQFATGALTQQRAMCLLPPTYGFVGASTITDAVGLCVGAPAAGTNATITNTHGIRVGAGAVGAGTTNSYGLTVNAQTGATNNYAAQFLGGKVGIGTSAPLYDLSFGATVNRAVGVERRGGSGAGYSLTVRGGSVLAGSTDQAGGTLELYPGISTGIGGAGTTNTSSVNIYAYPGALASGTADNIAINVASAVGVGGTSVNGFAYLNIHRINSCTHPIANWNPFTPGSYLWDIADTNPLWGRATRVTMSRNAVALSTADKRVVTEGNFENFSNVNWRGLDGAADVVYSVDFTSDPTYGAAGIPYNLQAKFYINFYYGVADRFPSAWSARVKDKYGVWTAMTLTREGSSLVGIITPPNYLCEIEFTLSTGTGGLYVSGTTKWSITQLQLHLVRMAYSQGGGISSIGGYFGNNVTAYEGFSLSSTKRITWQAGGIVVSTSTAPAAGAMLHVVGAGATSATNTALFENSSGTDILTVRDDNSVLVGGATTNYSRLTVQSEDSPAVFTPSTMPAYTVGLGRVLSNTGWAGNGFVFSGPTLGNDAFSLLWNGTKAFFGILSDASSTFSRFMMDATGVSISAGTVTTGARLHVVQTTAASATSVPGLLVVGAAHTAHTLSTESQDIYFDLSRTVQFATGALTTQRAFFVEAPTYGFVGASTLTDAMTVAISGAPVKGTNATITNTHALHIAAGAVSTATNSYGLTVNAQTGGTNNYAAQFLGGNVGIGISAPTAMLDVNSDIVRVRTAKTPASAAAAGNAGDICWDANYIYVCVAANTWKRSAIATW